MNLPGQPPTFVDKSSGDDASTFWWRFEVEGRAAAPPVPEEFADQRFASQSEAESWVGEIWAELAEEGVDAVTLFQGEQEIYGPMSLHP